MKTSMMIIALTLIAATMSFGQSTSAPKPGLEHAKLAGLVGNWITAGESTENSFGPPEKFSGKILSEWFAGGFAVVRHVDGKSSQSGEVHSLEVISYDTAARAYTWYSIDNRGVSLLGKTSIAGNTLTAVWEFGVKGKTYQVRGTLKGLGSDKLTWIQEYSEDGKTWKTYFRSTDTRVKS